MTYEIPDHVLEERIGDEIVLLSLKRETFFSLNASGIALWEQIKAAATVAHLEQLLIERYGLDSTQAAADVAAFVGELLKLELLSSTKS